MATSNSNNKKTPALEQTGAAGFEKLFAFYRSTGNNLPFARQKNAKVMFKSTASYEKTVHDLSGSGTYTKLAGADVANIFFPYETTYSSGVMPCFYPSGTLVLPAASGGVIINIEKLLPFRWNRSPSGTIYYRPKTDVTHDGLGSIVSSNKYYGDTDTYRDTNYMRTIGIRLPMMGVGWGYTNDGLPFPSNSEILYGSGVNEYLYYKFKGGYDHGYQVHPDEYIAAPIDLRYNPQKHVWSGPVGFWAEIQGSSGVYVTASGVFASNGSGLLTAYQWTEVVPADNGDFITPNRYRTGTFTKMPAFEVNNMDVPTSAIVYFPPKDREDRYYFMYGGTSGSGNLDAAQYQYMTYQMVVQNRAGFDFVRRISRDRIIEELKWHGLDFLYHHLQMLINTNISYNYGVRVANVI